MTDKLQFNDTAGQTLFKLSQGNPGALGILIRLIKEHLPIAAEVCYVLDDMNILGSRIWLGYQDYCKADADKLFKLILSRDSDLVAFLNQEKYGFEDKAVCSGASTLEEVEYYEGLTFKRA